MKTSNIKIAFFLNLSFTLFEIVGGLMTNSVALISDAIHDLGDSLSLGVSWYLEHLSKKKPNETFTYGYGRFSVLGGLITSVVLLIGIIFIMLEAIPRVLNPEPINAPVVLVFAVFGVLVNGYAAYKTTKGSSINERVISLHLLEDVLGWAILLIAAAVMSFIELPILDPILSILYSLFILYHVFKNLKEIGLVFLEGFDQMSEQQLISKLVLNQKVLDVHHVHYWTLDGHSNYISLHVLLKEETSPKEHDEIIHDLKHQLEHLNFHHATIESEYQKCQGENCPPTVEQHHHHH